MAPQAIVIAVGAVITGGAAGVTVMVLLPVMVLSHASLNVHVSVSVPPQPVMVPVRTAVTVPAISQVPVAELV